MRQRNSEPTTTLLLLHRKCENAFAEVRRQHPRRCGCFCVANATMRSQTYVSNLCNKRNGESTAMRSLSHAQHTANPPQYDCFHVATCDYATANPPQYGCFCVANARMRLQRCAGNTRNNATANPPQCGRFHVANAKTQRRTIPNAVASASQLRRCVCRRTLGTCATNAIANPPQCGRSATHTTEKLPL